MGTVEDAVGADSFPEVFVNVVICTAVNKKTRHRRVHSAATKHHRQAIVKLIGVWRHSHVPQVFRDRDGDFVEGVPRGRAVGVEGPDALCCDDLIVCGVACGVFDHVELKTARDRDF